VACRWRIRQKLILAHGLGVAIVVLLLCGTLYGLISFRTTTRTFNKKMSELHLAEELQKKVKALADQTGIVGPDEISNIASRIADAKAELNKYDERLQEYQEAAQQSDYAIHQREEIEGLRENLARLSTVVLLDAEQAGTGISSPAPLRSRSEFQEPLNLIRGGADDLVSAITGELRGRLDGANWDYKICLWFELSITAVGFLAMIGSLRFFYRWIFYPIRDLQAGVERVARGDFENDIQIQSSDELQVLAGAFNDMTHRLAAMYSDLARQVNERSRQLVRSERLANVGFLAAGVAHEINNPLASIAFCSEALERRIQDMLAQIPPSSTAAEESKVVTKYLKMIQQESFRCKEITSRLLEFSRGGEKRREPTDLGELVESVLDMVQHLEVRSSKNLLFDPKQRVVAMVNGQEIKSVVVNLVVNALESMESGGTLSITLESHDGQAELVFEDTGCGMTAEVLENIFEPFFTRSRGGKGTGLGLSICHRIISQHQGEIEARSAGANKGSTFIVRVPLVPSGAGSEQPARRDESEAWHEPAVLRPARKAA
jgi:two-component system, NtrC family, sensor kinase